MADSLGKSVAALQPAGTRVNKTLPAALPAPTIPSRTGESGRIAKPASSGGGGIASPLTETGYAYRTWHTTGVKSTDGLFMLPALKSITMADANGAEVILNFKRPT